jgi:hypothetical protein
MPDPRYAVFVVDLSAPEPAAKEPIDPTMWPEPIDLTILRKPKDLAILQHTPIDQAITQQDSIVESTIMLKLKDVAVVQKGPIDLAFAAQDPLDLAIPVIPRKPRVTRGRLALAAAAALAVLAAASTSLFSASARVPALPKSPAWPATAALPAAAAPETLQELRVVNDLRGVAADPVFASAADFSDAVVLRRGGRSSLALQMTAEPSKATLRALSPTVLEVEVGPLSRPVKAGAFTASAWPLVNQVSFREAEKANRNFLRSRIILNAPGRGDIRIAGRIVYVDLTPLD